MNKEQILRALHAGAVQVTFTKKDGTERVMECTLQDDMIPQPELPLEENKKERKENPDVQAVWDIENQGWRSFRWDSITMWAAGA
jgi:hypothetical protein